MNNTKPTPVSAPTQSAPCTFPKPDTPLGRILNDSAYRAAFHQRLKSSNPFVVAFYRMGLLPLLGAGSTTMLLTTLGRKSHRPRSFPVGYFRISGDIYLISGWGRDSNWYKNLQANPSDVSIQIGFHQYPVQAQILKDTQEIRSILECLVAESPASATRLFGWDPQTDRIASADFSAMFERVVFVRFVKR